MGTKPVSAFLNMQLTSVLRQSHQDMWREDNPSRKGEEPQFYSPAVSTKCNCDLR